jgi:hypothetical protein
MFYEKALAVDGEPTKEQIAARIAYAESFTHPIFQSFKCLDKAPIHCHLSNLARNKHFPILFFVAEFYGTDKITAVTSLLTVTWFMNTNFRNIVQDLESALTDLDWNDHSIAYKI